MTNVWFQVPSSIQDDLTYTYLMTQFRRYQVTTEKICRGQHEVVHMGRAYLCYLNSLRRYEVSTWG